MVPIPVNNRPNKREAFASPLFLVRMGGIFRLGSGLLALRAARAFACATLPQKTVYWTFFIAASNPSEKQTKPQRDPFGFLCGYEPHCIKIPYDFDWDSNYYAPKIMLILFIVSI